MAYRGNQLRHSAVPIGRPAVIAVLTAAVITTSFWLVAAGCSVSTPERTVKDFVSARIAGDQEKAAQLSVEGDLTGFMGGEPSLNGSGVVFDVSPAEVDNDRAVVTVHYYFDDEVADIPYVCLRTGAKWKVALRETEEAWLGQTP